MTKVAGMIGEDRLAVKKVPPQNPSQMVVKQPSKGFFWVLRSFPVVYAAMLGSIFVFFGGSVTPDFLVFVCFLCAAYMKKTRVFLKDWIPFISLWLAYDAMRGLVHHFAGVVHIIEPISAEIAVFGCLPTLVLQQSFRSLVLDCVGAFFYSLHFLLLTAFGFLLWHYSRGSYKKFTVAFILTSYTALITFLLYPVAPPWYGVEATRILFQVDRCIGVPLYATLYAVLEPNPFAAIPSLHAAYPWLIFLFAYRLKGVKSLPFLTVPVGVCFSAVYLGEHYIVDLLIGVLYATVAFYLTERLVK